MNASRILDRTMRLHQGNKFVEAESGYRRLLKRSPNDPEILRLLGLSVAQQGKHEDGLPYLQESVAKAPRNPYGLANLAATLRMVGEDDEALRVTERLMAQKPSRENQWAKMNAAFGRGLIRLSRGDWPAGWADYQCGVVSGDRPDANGRRSSAPAWTGRELESGKTLLVWWEQGYGDTINFTQLVPYVSELAGRQCTIVYEVQPALKELLAETKGVDLVTDDVSQTEMVPDFQVSLMDLPFIFALRLDDLTGIGYIEAKEAHRWGQAVANRGGVPIGFCHKGSAAHGNDTRRSTQFPDWCSLLEDSKPAVFHSLVYGESQHDFKSFTELAGIMANLDLVITVDTAVAHLAGALGIPTWLLVASVSDFRWLKGRSDSVWYKSVRLYRQTAPGDWPEVLARVKADLARCLQQYRVIERV